MVFAEGLKTEEAYIVDWYRHHRDKILVTVDDFRGGPLQLVEHAVDAKRSASAEAKRGRGRAYDQYWCVFDVDEHPGIPQALALAATHGIEIALSNPCLELWFILHFEDQMAFIHRHDAQDRSEALLKCKKVLMPEALAALRERHNEALARAQRLDDWHEGNGSPVGENPSTGAWRLIEAIRSA